MFNLEQPVSDDSLLDCIPTLVSEEDNETLHNFPTEEEIKKVVFSTSIDSSAMPDGYYQYCWNIIKHDVRTFCHGAFLK